jgi:hypothetical protein
VDFSARPNRLWNLNWPAPEFKMAARLLEGSERPTTTPVNRNGTKIWNTSGSYLSAQVNRPFAMRQLSMSKRRFGSSTAAPTISKRGSNTTDNGHEGSRLRGTYGPQPECHWGELRKFHRKAACAKVAPVGRDIDTFDTLQKSICAVPHDLIEKTIQLRARNDEAFENSLTAMCAAVCDTFRPVTAAEFVEVLNKDIRSEIESGESIGREVARKRRELRAAFAEPVSSKKPGRQPGLLKYV